MVKTRARTASTRETTDRRDGVDEGGVGSATDEANGFDRDGDGDDDDDDADARVRRRALEQWSDMVSFSDEDDSDEPSCSKRTRSSDDDDVDSDVPGGSSAEFETRDAWRESSYHPKHAFGGGQNNTAWSYAWASVSHVVPMVRRHFDHVRDDGFHGGDAREILLRCRRGDNEPYDEEDVDSMLEDLKEHGKTVNAPFCCARGAVELKRLARLESWRRWRRGKHEARGFSFLKYAQTSDVLHVYGGADFGFGECEVGVYVSVANGDIAEWHRDVGDNATIQITGSKKWEVEEWVLDATQAHGESNKRVNFRNDGFIRPFVGELAGMSRNASLEDERTCGVDHFAQPETLPRAHPIDFGATPPPNERYEALGHRMRSVLLKRVVIAGDTICVPRGRFHRVTPVGEEVSVSVDLRMTNIERGEWRAEAAYLREFMLAGLWGDARDAVKKLDERPFGEFPQMLATPIRWLPFEEEFSDGLVLGARLEYIVGAVDNAYDRRDTLKTYMAMPKRFHDSDDTVRRFEDCYGETYGPDVYRRDGTITPAVFFNPVCTCSITDSSEHPDYDVLNIKATSALTNKDLMNEFNIYIRKGSIWENERAALQNPIAFYCSEMDSNCYRGSTRTECDSCAGGKKPGDDSESDHASHIFDNPNATCVTDAFASLREVLVDANILVEDVTGSSVVGLFWKSLATRHFANPHDVTGDPVDIDIGNAPVPRVRNGMVSGLRADFVSREHERLFDIPKWYEKLRDEDDHIHDTVVQ